MGAPKGSNAHGGPLVRLLSGDQEDHFDGCHDYDWVQKNIHDHHYGQDDHDDSHEYLNDVVDLDEGDGEVVRGGVEPLDGGHHAAVVNCTQELRLVEEILVKFV